MPPDQYPLTPEAITGIVAMASFVISALLLRAPRLSEAWAAMDGDYKRGILFAMYLTAALSVMALRCGMVQACLQANLWLAVNVAFTAFASSQGAFVMLAPKPNKPSGQ